MMCIVIMNLFVGIAVSDIKQVLDEADIRHISIKIIFVLRIQSTVDFVLDCLKSELLNEKFRMNYNLPKSETKVFKKLAKVKGAGRNFFRSQVGDVNLKDPQQRLEGMLSMLSKVRLNQIIYCN